jgi:hypothetical protein
MSHDVFISYSKEDRSTADRLCEVMEAQGLACWIAPRDIPAGAEWATSIVDGIRAARSMIILISARVSASQEVPREIRLADKCRIPIIPVRLEPCELVGEFDYFLGNRQWLDCFPAPVDPHVPAVVQAIHEALHKPEAPGVTPSPASSTASAAAPAVAPMVTPTVAPTVAPPVAPTVTPLVTSVPPAPAASAVEIDGGPWAVRLRVDPDSPFPAADLTNQGFRPAVFRVYRVGSQQRVAALFLRDGLQSSLNLSPSREQWEIDYRNIAAQGARLVRLTCGRAPAGANVISLWTPALNPGAPWRFLYLAQREAFQSWAQQFFAGGLTVGDVSVSSTGAAPEFTGVWFGPGPASLLNIGLSWPELQTLQLTMLARGFRIVALSGYSEGALAKYAAAWQQTGPCPQQMVTASSAEDFQLQCAQFGRQGFRLALMDAFDIDGAERYAGVWEA